MKNTHDLLVGTVSIGIPSFSPGHCFLCCNQLFFRGNVELTFSFLLVLRLSFHAVCYANNEERDQ